MKTEDFVAMLARGNAGIVPPAYGRRFVVGLGLGTAASGLLLAGMLDIRVDLAAALRLPMFWVKSGFAASLMLASLMYALRLSRPGTPVGHAPGAIAEPIAAIWLLAILSLIAPGV
ncbi:MAG: DUF1109 domain-containing protein [Gammaproteobacteria bacterium]|nr:DUF1109 domain-containing protein [Gammaproteobacteria bacterium]